MSGDEAWVRKIVTANPPRSTAGLTIAFNAKQGHCTVDGPAEIVSKLPGALRTAPRYWRVHCPNDGAHLVSIRDGNMCSYSAGSRERENCFSLRGGEPMVTIRKLFGTPGATIKPATTAPGVYSPRIARGVDSPAVKDTLLFRDAYIASVRVLHMLAAEMRDIFRQIEPVAAHNGVYSQRLRELLILACTEVESS